MALLEYRRLQPELTLANDAGTWQFKLPRTGLINCLVLRVEITNGATSCKDEDVYDAIDRVEVVANGSRFLFSLTGQQCRLWTHVYMKQRPPYVRDETPSIVQEAFILIPFGMNLSDPNHYLDCSLYSDLELRVTYSPTIAATSFATGTTVVSVFGLMWRGMPQGGYQGFLRTTEQTYFTSLAAGDTNYDLPIGNPMVALGMYVYEAGISPEANIDDFELDIDNGSWSPVVGQWEVLNQLFTEYLGINPLERGIVYKSDTDVIETRTGTLGQMFHDTIQSLTIGVTDQVHTVISGYAGGQATIQSLSRDAASVAADAANVTDGPIKWVAWPKFGLGNFLVVPFGFFMPGADMLNSAEYGRIRAVMTNGNAGAEVRLSLMEVVQR